jgi:hypothetical protein
MRPKAYVLEIRKKGDIRNLCYFSLASALDLNYLYQFGEPEDKNKNNWDADLYLDINILEKNLELMETA